MSTDPDVLIVGGGILGGSVLHHLVDDGHSGRITVLESLETVGQGSTAYTAGAFRNLWTTPVNMHLNNYSIERFREFEKDFGVNIGFHQIGYLFTYYDKEFQWARGFLQTWRDNGVRCHLLSADEVEKRVPNLRTGIEHIDPEVLELIEFEAIVGGVLGPDCGTFDPTVVCQAYFDRASSDRVTLECSTEVARILLDGGRVRGVQLRDGQVREAEIVVLAAGAWAARLLEASGLTEGDNVPVDPLKRQIFVTNLPPTGDYEGMPLTIIDKGIYFRHEAGNFIIGRARVPEPPGFNTDPEPDYYVNEINLYMQERIEGAERCRLASSSSMWAGLYPECRLDHNGILGWHPRVPGLFLAVGFGGHGAMQAPAAGKAASEMIRLGRYETVDASPLDFLRFEEGRLVLEAKVI